MNGIVIASLFAIALGIAAIAVWYFKRDLARRISNHFFHIPVPVAAAVLIALGCVALGINAAAQARKSNDQQASQPATAQTPQTQAEAVTVKTPDTPAEAKTPNTPTAPTSTSGSTTAIEGKAESKASYEQTDFVLDVHLNDRGVTVADAIVEVKNTGNVDLELDSARFEIINESGSVIATEEAGVLSAPKVIAPGEKGYFYTASPIELPGGYFPGYNYELGGEMRVPEAVLHARSFPVSEEYVEESPSGLRGGCWVQNDTSVDSIVTLYGFYYDNDNRIIGVGQKQINYLTANEGMYEHIDPEGLPAGCTYSICAGYRFVCYGYEV